MLALVIANSVGHYMLLYDTCSIGNESVLVLLVLIQSLASPQRSCFESSQRPVSTLGTLAAGITRKRNRCHKTYFNTYEAFADRVCLMRAKGRRGEPLGLILRLCRQEHCALATAMPAAEISVYSRHPAAQEERRQHHCGIGALRHWQQSRAFAEVDRDQKRGFPICVVG